GPGLAVTSRSPAFDGAAGDQRTAAELAGADRRRGRDASDCDGRGTLNLGLPVPELAVVVSSPAFDGATPKQRTGVPEADADRDGVPDAFDGDRRREVGVRRVAENAEGVGAPTLDGAA